MGQTTHCMRHTAQYTAPQTCMHKMLHNTLHNTHCTTHYTTHCSTHCTTHTVQHTAQHTAQVFEVFRHAPNDPAAVAMRRRERVISRFQAREQFLQELQEQQQVWSPPAQQEVSPSRTQQPQQQQVWFPPAQQEGGPSRTQQPQQQEPQLRTQAKDAAEEWMAPTGPQASLAQVQGAGTQPGGVAGAQASLPSPHKLSPGQADAIPNHAAAAPCDGHSRPGAPETQEIGGAPALHGGASHEKKPGLQPDGKVGMPGRQPQQHLPPGMARQLRRRAQRQLEQLQGKAGQLQQQQDPLCQDAAGQPPKEGQVDRLKTQARLHEGGLQHKALPRRTTQQPQQPPTHQQQHPGHQELGPLLHAYQHNEQDASALALVAPAPPFQVLPFQQWLPPTGRARAAAAEGALIGAPGCVSCSKSMCAEECVLAPPGCCSLLLGHACYSAAPALCSMDRAVLYVV